MFPPWGSLWPHTSLGRWPPWKRLPKGPGAGQPLPEHPRWCLAYTLITQPSLKRGNGSQRVQTHTQACRTPTEALSLSGTQAGSGQVPKGTRWGSQQNPLLPKPRDRGEAGVLVCVRAQSRLTLCDPGSPPGSSVHGIFQARILEWGAIKGCYEGSKRSPCFGGTPVLQGNQGDCFSALRWSSPWLRTKMVRPLVVDLSCIRPYEAVAWLVVPPQS